MPAPAPIDAVYTWVDGTRPDYLELIRHYSKTPGDLNPERFRDHFGFLRYSLRSLEQNAPWVRNVYLFTARPQVPQWLRLEHPRLRIVHHDEVMPDDGTQPTFNSNVIESFLHLLPGISEQFLYFNDDYFLGAATTRADFFALDGRIKVFGTFVGESFRRRVFEHQILSCGLLEHVPTLVDRVAWTEALAGAAEDIAESRRHRFRQRDDVRVERLYHWHLLRRAQPRGVAEPFWRFLPNSAFHKIKPGVAKQRRALDKLRRRRPRFLCLNDDLGVDADAAVVEEVRVFLEEWFPRPSSFER